MTIWYYLNLTLHRNAEECDEVHDEDWPKHGDVEKLEEGAEKGDEGGLGRRVPKLELWQPPDERPKLVRLPRGQLHALVGLLSLKLSHGRVDLRRQEGQEQVQVVDRQGVRHDVPSLKQKRLQSMLPLTK